LELSVRLADSYPVPKCDWAINDQLIINNESHIIETNNSEQKLIILNANESDEGIYSFKSYNEFGSVETSCKTSILGMSDFFLISKINNI
jgi:hypothetical protein